MAPFNDDLDIRAVLAEMTRDQPPAPPARLAAIRRQAAVMRHRRIATTVVAAVAVVAVAVSLAVLTRSTVQQPLARRAPNWALPWPDHRNHSVPQLVLDEAVIAWRYRLTGPPGAVGTVPALNSSPRQVAALANAYPVVWYVGQTVDHGADVVVIFEVNGPQGPQLVVGWALASQVMGEQPAWNVGASPWALAVSAAPSPRKPPMAIGEFAWGPPANPGNWLVVLAAPDVRSISWFATTVAGLRSDRVPASTGLAIADAGQLTSQVKLTGLSTAHGFVKVANLSIWSPPGGSAQYSPPPPALSVPASFAVVASEGGQVLRGQSGGSVADPSFVRGSRQYAILAICIGPGSLRPLVNGHHLGAVPCDGKQHEQAVPPSALRTRGLVLSQDGSNTDTYQVLFAAVRRS